jgi:uncharacterized MAPEG superfamily protein
MPETLAPYHSTLIACVVLAGLVLLQVLVADFASIRAKHVPGMPITEGHGSFLFRSARALANTNETLGLFLLLAALALALGANAQWTAILAWTYVAARAGHMGFYYLRMGLARSISFGVGLAAQAALLVVVVMAIP